MNRLISVVTRMAPDLRDAIEAMPGLGGVALWVKFLDSDDPELIAGTDGVHVEAGPGYEKYDDAEGRFIVLHELLHVALAHPARGREMERRIEGFDARLYNIACDAMINAALDGAPGVHTPDGAVTLGELLAPQCVRRSPYSFLTCHPHTFSILSFAKTSSRRQMPHIGII